MLRRKLLLILGSLVALVVIAGVVAIVLLQGVLKDLDRISTQALGGTTAANQLGATITTIEGELSRIAYEDVSHLDDLIDAVETLERQAAGLGGYGFLQAEGGEHLRRLDELIPRFVHHVGNLATTPDPEISADHTALARETSAALRREIAELGRITQNHMQAEQDAVTVKYRWTVLGVILVFLLVVNVSIMVLLRAAAMVLRPVDHLVEASRRLASEEFDHRVVLNQRDEFGELAEAFNRLAASLQAHEKQRIETLHHVARTLNHELNNAMSIIELKLQMLVRGNDRSHAMEGPLHEIQEALRRMSRTIQTLQHIKRIVLTEYLEGIQMLDLEQSAREETVSGMLPFGTSTEATER